MLSTIKLIQNCIFVKYSLAFSTAYFQPKCVISKLFVCVVFLCGGRGSGVCVWEVFVGVCVCVCVWGDFLCGVCVNGGGGNNPPSFT